MTRQHKASLYRAAAVAGLILAAYFCRKFAYVTAAIWWRWRFVA